MSNQPTNHFFRQGDLLIRKIWTIPTNAIPKSTNIIGEGEKTDHTHTLNGPHQIFETPDYNAIYFEAKQELSIEHPEHNKITIPKGVYTVVHERQFNPFEERNEDVFD